MAHEEAFSSQQSAVSEKQNQHQRPFTAEDAKESKTLPLSHGKPGQANADEQERGKQRAEALAIKLNRLPGEGGWDSRAFAEILEDLATNDTELFDSLAIPHDEIDRMLGQVDPETLPGGIRENEPVLQHLPDDGDHGDGLSPDDEGRSSHTTCPACGHQFSGR